jgi:hypothetical protein
LYVGPGSITIGSIVLTDNSGQLAVTGSTGQAFSGDTVITGNLTVNGTTTTINSATLSVDDKNIELGSVASATGLVGTITGTSTSTTITGITSTVGLLAGQVITRTSGTGAFGGTTTIASIDSLTQITISSTTSNTTGSIVFAAGGSTNLTADGGGFTIKGTTDKTFSWSNSASAFTSSEDINVVAGKQYEINGSSVLSKTTLTLSGSSSGTVAFQTASAAGSATYTLPTAYPGTAGFALVSDLSGVLSWAAAGAAITTDTSTTTLYPAMSTSTSGNFTAAKVNTGLTFNGTTGVLTTSGGFVESSSITLKENVMPITNALETILQLCGVTYDRKDGSKKNEPGLIAERVAEIADNLVMRDENGKPSGIYYSKITAYLVEAIKGLHDQLDPLKEEIKKLKGE